MKIVRDIASRYRALPLPVRASLWFVVCSFLQRGISVITTPIFTRLLTTAEYGQYNVFNSWLGIATVIVSLNLYQGVYSQGLIKFESDRQRFSSSLQGLTLVLVTIWTVVYFMFHSPINHALSLTTPQVLCMLSMIWTTAVFNFWAVDKRVDYKYRALIIITLLSSLAKPVLGIILVIISEDKVTARIIGLAVVELAFFAWMFFVQLMKGRTFLSFRYWKYALLFNLPLVPHYLSLTLLNSADRILIAGIVGESEAGIYSLAYSVSQIMLIFNTALMQSLEPWMYRKIRDEKSADIQRVTYPCLILIGLLNTALIGFAPEVVALFAPEEYSDAIWVIPPVSLSVFLMFAYSLFAAFELYYEKTGMVAGATLVVTVINIGLNWALIPLFGYIAAGYITLACYALLALFHYMMMRSIARKKQLGEIYSPKKLLAIIACFAFVCALLACCYELGTMRLILIIGLIAVCVLCRGRASLLVHDLLSIRSREDG